MDLRDYVQVVDDALSKDICDRVIKLFHQPDSDDKKIRFDRNQRPNYTLFNFTENRHLDPELHIQCEQSALKAIDYYKSKVQETYWWPKTYGFEQFRVKYYRNNDDDMFATHVDGGNFGSSKRFFLFFWYLNDVEEGGETTLDNLGIKVTPKAGRMVMFPPFWMYPHTGHKPISGPKYLLSTYLHYVKTDGSV